MITPGQPCADCARPMHRRGQRHDGTAHAGRGLCGTCYVRNSRAGLLGTYSVGRGEVDEMAVERAVLGDPPRRLNHAERAAVVEALTRRGESAAMIAARIGVAQRTVVRHRAKDRGAG